MKPAVSLLERAAVVFWDFDGVVKDSVLNKSIGFERLFLPYGVKLAKRVRQHHEAHGGVSRYDKMPIYLGWAGEATTTENIQFFCDRFSGLVLQSVIDAAWVPGVREYLKAQYAKQHFVLVTATPQEEIQQILDALDIARCFRDVYGAPISKTAAIRDVLQRLQCQPGQALVVGDSETDFNAAEMNGVAFMLRRTSLNQDLQKRFNGVSFECLDF